MDTTKWKSVAIRTEIEKMSDKIPKKTERPKSYGFAYAIKRLAEDIDNGKAQ